MSATNAAGRTCRPLAASTVRQIHWILSAQGTRGRGKLGDDVTAVVALLDHGDDAVDLAPRGAAD